MANHPQPGPVIPEPASDPWHSAPLFEGGPVPSQPGPAEGFEAAPYQPGPPPPGRPAYGADPSSLGPLAPARRGLSTTVVMLITAVAVVVVGGGIFLGYSLTNDNNDTPTVQGSSGTATATKGATSQATRTATSAPSASTAASERNFLTAKVGECLENRSNNNHQPDMHLTACKVGAYSTYELLSRYDGTTDEDRCNGTPRLSTTYHYELGDTKVVFCLRKLT